jgi:4-hydroxy-tetrahydrodipicolinate synthase
VLAHGGDGVVSVASNEIPGVMASLCAAARSGDWEEARRIHERYLPLFRANFLTVNPVPVKAALAAMGLIEDYVRQPLLTLAEPQRGQLMEVLRDAGLVVPVAGVAR